MIRVVLTLASALVLLSGSIAGAQQRTLAEAESLLESGDSARALRSLQALVRSDARNAPAWHRLGLLAWRLAEGERSGRVMGRREIQLRLLADSALRWATILAPDSAAFYASLGRFQLQSGVSTVRLAAAGTLARGLEAAKRTGQQYLAALLADEVGMVHWRRYESFADRRSLAIGTSTPDIQPATTSRDVENITESFTRRLSGMPGERDYLTALDYFDEALRADPNNGRALRHKFMALAQQRRWEEVRHAATTRLQHAPWDPQAWLAHGLASHRLNDPRTATASFDSALAFLTAEDRARYTRLSRLLRKKDAARVDTLPPDQKAATERLYWAMTDPLWLTPANEHWTEFLSRVAYSELMWTSDELGYRGADTDRGEIHIRYGPPDEIVNFGPGMGGTHSVLWRYASGISFVFRQPPSFGTATFADDFANHARELRERVPVTWSNVPLNRALDSIPVQIARFRAFGDSADVFIAAELPLDSLLQNVDIRNPTLAVSVEMYDRFVQRILRDSTRQTAGDASSGTRLRSWRKRVDAGGLYYRIEALQPESMRAARAAGNVAVSDSGAFALSDVLLAERVLPRSETEPRRWSDFNIAPSAGRFRRGQRIDLIWESYGLRESRGANRYRVTITLTKRQKSTAERFVATIVGGVQGAVGASGRGRDRAAITFTREVPARDVAVDYLTLDLGTAAPGLYTLTVDVTDLVSLRRSRRESTLMITR